MTHVLSDERYLAALERQRARIAAGLQLVAIDSTEPGNKFTHCSWGLCSQDREAWPDREDHLWPEQFDQGRIAPIYRQEHQACPLDKRDTGAMGCFYTCRVFQGALADPEEALRLYDAKIASLEETNGA